MGCREVYHTDWEAQVFIFYGIVANEVVKTTQGDHVGDSHAAHLAAWLSHILLLWQHC